jgi:YD repeat-containing protein
MTCVTEGSCLAVCTVNTSHCAPPSAPDETCPTCNKLVAGQPISLASGDTTIEQKDIDIPGLGGGLKLVRTWNSKWPSTQAGSQAGLFGPNWRSTYEERVFLGSDSYMKYARSDGSFWSFGYDSPTWHVAAPANESASLVDGSTYWTLTFKNGEQRQFDNASGNLIAIIDRNGNTTQLTYDGLDRLATVTDPAGRHLSFTYSSSSSYLIIGVSSDVGLSLSYAYDAQGRLITVTKPDNTTLSFEYNAQSLITAVKDSNGIVLESHTYDSNGRGLTSSRANSVEAVTVSYGQQ